MGGFHGQLPRDAYSAYSPAKQNGPNPNPVSSEPRGGGPDRLTLISLAGTAAVLLAVVLLFTVPGLSDLATAGYDTMYRAMNYMAEMCRF